MKFPYGLADFHAIIEEDYYYADRTRHIALLEETGKQVLFLRPRRFGKSLFLTTLENYYDLGLADQFDALFGKLWIGQNPTPRHNHYFVMRWDFSMVKASGTLAQIEQALHDHINGCIEAFIRRYPKLLSSPIENPRDNGIRGLQSVAAVVRAEGRSLYLLIDEYDNFANEVMSARKEDYAALVHGEGLIKTVFKAIKGLSSGQGIDRVFITGVSPVVMSDVSSGYNVAENITLDAQFEDVCGFSEQEIQQAVWQVGKECGFNEEKTQETLEIMRTFYNGYGFGYQAAKPIYNPTLALYFLKSLQTTCQYPHEIMDSNLAMDRNRIAYVASLPHGQHIIAQALDPDNPPIIGQLANKFGVEDMLQASKDQPFMASLLYYLGVLTVSGQDEMGRLVLRIPNLVIRRLYVERLQETFLPEYEDKENLRHAAEHFYGTGDLAPLCEFIETRYFQVYDNRDYRFSNELVIKTAFLITLFSDTFYIMDSETAIERKYTDLSMIIRPDMRRFKLLDHLFEFKYIGLKELNLSGEQVKQISRADLMCVPLVAEKLAAAESQLADYRATLESVYGEKLRLHTHAVVALGFDRLVWQSSPSRNA